MKSDAVNGAQEFCRTRLATQVVGIDESNFFGLDWWTSPASLPTAEAGAHRRARYRLPGPPFTPMPELALLPNHHQKCWHLYALRKSRQAHQRLVESSDLIVVGASGMYEARCRRCFEPGIPTGSDGIRQAARKFDVTQKALYVKLLSYNNLWGRLCNLSCQKTTNRLSQFSRRNRSSGPSSCSTSGYQNTRLRTIHHRNYRPQNYPPRLCPAAERARIRGANCFPRSN